MGWGRGRGRAPKAHYFEAPPIPEPEEHEESREQVLKKKLAEIQTLEERMRAGTTLSMGQIKKIESKAQLEQELQGLEEKEHVKEEEMIADLLKEKEELELEMAGVEPVLPGAVTATAPKAQPKAPTRLPLPSKPKRLAPWAPLGLSGSASPSNSPRAPSPTSSMPGTPRNDLRLPIPAHITEAQRSLLEGDLPYWAQKYASSAGVEADTVWAELGPEAAGSNVARQELFDLVEYDLELPKGALSSCNVAVRTPTRKTPQFGDSLADPETVFRCCDTDGGGKLDFHELRFALNAFGLFPTAEELRSWMDGRSSLSLSPFCQLLDCKLSSAPTRMRRPRAVPYARRGVRMQQVEQLHETFVATGWLQRQCTAFNNQHAREIRLGKCFVMETNLYALNRWVIMPSTTPGDQLDDSLRRAAGMPVATHESSFSELMNPDGLAVDYFVSHYWGHPFQDTRAALKLWSSQVYWQIGKRAMDAMVYWLCILALNQHCPGDEVGSSPEEGPFNAALVQSGGAVMIVDECVSPFSRIWCLFEVKRLTDLQKDFHLISAKGAMGANLGEMDEEQRQVLRGFTEQVAQGLESVSAYQAKSSSEDDKFAIWHRVADPNLRRVPLAVARERRLFNANCFKRFDLTIRSLLAAPLYHTSLQEADKEAALRYLGLGAPFDEKDLMMLSELNVDVCKVEVNVQSGTATVQWKLLHVAAYFGHEQAVEALVRRGANLEAQTKFKLTALHQAARNGQAKICEMLLDFKAKLQHTSVQGRSCLQAAAHQGHRNVVELLLARRADPNGTDDKGVTALHSAALAGQGDIVEVLLREGADPFQRQRDDLNALHVASMHGAVEVAREIVEKSPQRGKLLRAHSSKGSVLDLAGTAEMADFLRSVTADDE